MSTRKFRFIKPNVSEENKYVDIRSSQQGGRCSSIASSAEFVASISGGGGDVTVVGISTIGQRSTGIRPSLRAHQKPVTDLAFSPFDDYLLATCSEDGKIFRNEFFF
jgi:WD40 repeat protein